MKWTRRDFLGWSASAGVLPSLGCQSHTSPSQARSAAVPLERLEHALNVPVLQDLNLSSPVIIESIQVLRKGKDYFIHVRSRYGAEGISIPNSRIDNLSDILKRRVIPYFIGKDARDLEEHLFGVYRYKSNYKLQGIALWCPLAWVEFALLDMLGRIKGQSIGELFGPQVRTQVPFYVASGNRHTTPQEEVDYLKKLIDETGARAVKYRLGGRMSRNADSLPGRTPGLIRLSRRSLGDDIDIHADANSSYDPPQAIEVGKMLQDINAVYFEEPCPFDHLEDTKQVTDALDIPVAGGEQEFSERRFRWMVHTRGVDIVQPDLQYYGGLIRSTRVSRMAALAGMPTTVHISGGFGFVYMLHFASYTPDIGLYQEYKRGIERMAQWFDPPLSIKDGALSVPSGPGVGIVDVRGLLKGAVTV